jgi:rubrerythrin
VVPEDKGADYVKIPKTIKEALETGVQAEIDNIAMYDAFLKDKLMTQSANADIRALFVSLRDASKNHLGAFQNALARYK